MEGTLANRQGRLCLPHLIKELMENDLHLYEALFSFVPPSLRTSTRRLESIGSPYANNGDLRPRAGNGSLKIAQGILGRAGLAATLCPPPLPSLHLVHTPNQGQLA